MTISILGRTTVPLIQQTINASVKRTFQNTSKMNLVNLPFIPMKAIYIASITNTVQG